MITKFLCSSVALTRVHFTSRLQKKKKSCDTHSHFPFLTISKILNNIQYFLVFIFNALHNAKHIIILYHCNMKFCRRSCSGSKNCDFVTISEGSQYCRDNFYIHITIKFWCQLVETVNIPTVKAALAKLRQN